jgi:putative membrane protein insertion efficiency factor
MGHRHSSAQLSGDSGLWDADGRVAAPRAGGTFIRGGIAKEQVKSQHLFPANCGAAVCKSNATTQTIGAYALMFLVRFYMIFLSPFFGGACKFEPSCSNYAYKAIAVHGARRGSVLALKRLLRCRPFTVGGFDPVPELDSFVNGRFRVERNSVEPVQ